MNSKKAAEPIVTFAPVDTKTLEAMAEVFQKAILDIRVPAKDEPTRSRKAPDLYLNMDVPIMRAMDAVFHAVRGIDAESKLGQAYVMRIIHLPQIILSRKRFGNLITVNAETPVKFTLSDAVMHAAATAKISMNGEDIAYDMDEVLRLAKQYAEAHPA